MKKIRIIYNEGNGINETEYAKIKIPKLFKNLPSKIYTEKAVQNVRDGLCEKFAITIKSLEAKIKELTPVPAIPLYRFEVIVSNGAELENETVTVEAEGWSKDDDVTFCVGPNTVALFAGNSVRRIAEIEQINK